jgi:hypothetical protein
MGVTCASFGLFGQISESIGMFIIFVIGLWCLTPLQTEQYVNDIVTISFILPIFVS